MQKGLSIMKRITTFFVLLALLFSLFSCSENTENGEHSVDAVSGEYNGSSEGSKSVFFGDIEVPVDAEYQILVSDKLNSDVYFSLPFQRADLTGDELDKIQKIRRERRTEYAKSLYPPTSSVSCSPIDGQSDSLQYSRAFMIGSDTLYRYNSDDDNISASRYADSEELRSYSNYLLKRQKGGDSLIVSNIDEAIEYAFDFAKNELGLYKADEYEIYRVQFFPYEDGHSIYDVQFIRMHKGILTDIAVFYVNDTCGVVGWVNNGGQKRLDFKDACIDYATARMTDDAALAALRNASNNTDVAEIRNIQRYYIGTDAEGFYELVRGQTMTTYNHRMCGATYYSEALDKTEVYFYYSYTAVMKDGSEKQGCNVVSVFLPIDWAEVYGEKDTISNTNE